MNSIKVVNDFVQGDDLFVYIEYQDGTDITHRKFKLTFREKIDASPDLEITYIPGTNVNDDVINGICFIPITAAQSATLSPGKYFIELEELHYNQRQTLLKTGLNAEWTTVFSNLRN